MSEMSQFGAHGLFQPFLLKTDLDSVISIMGSRLDLRHDAGACFDYGHGNDRPVWPEHLRHADLPAQQTTEHILFSLPSVASLQPVYPYWPINRPMGTINRFLRIAHAWLQLDFDVHACGQIQSCQRLYRLVGRLNDIDQAFVRSYLKLLARIFIDER